MKKTHLPYTVSIIIPNWNGRNLLEKNLPSIISACHGAEIVVSDDGSRDGSVEFLKRAYPDITVVESTTNSGFSGNVNRGVARARGDIVLLLNTDVRPDKNFLRPLLSHFEDPKIAAVGCLEESHEPQGTVRRGRGRARWIKGYFIHERGNVDAPDTAWVSGGSAAYRKSVWNELGGMDPIYNPFYWEDIDLSYQMLKAGYGIRFERDSVVHHYHEEGAIKTDFSKNRIRTIAARNQFQFHWKNISSPSLIFAHAIWTPIRLLQSVVRGDWAMIRGYMMAIFRLPGIIDSRMRAARHWKLADTDLFHS